MVAWPYERERLELASRNRRLLEGASGSIAPYSLSNLPPRLATICQSGRSRRHLLCLSGSRREREQSLSPSLAVQAFRQLAAINQPIGGDNNDYHSLSEPDPRSHDVAQPCAR